MTAQEVGVQLGRRLFYDADLSADGSMSCATCHARRHAFADGNRPHPGMTDQPGVRNVPSLANVGAFSTLTWIDQHVTRLDRQFFIPMMGHHPVEMGMPDRTTLVGRIAGNACYRHLFARAFPRAQGRIDADTIATAVALFERTLVSRDSAWDQARQGRVTLKPEAAHGQALPDDDEAALESFLRALTDVHFLHDPALALPPEACPA
nr:cytochrome-c peroxidase [Gluconacetobacter tumulicola]